MSETLETLRDIDPDKIYQTDEVAELINMTTRTVTTALKEGTLKGVKSNGNKGNWLIEGRFIREWLTESKESMAE